MKAQYICPVITAFLEDGTVDMDMMKILYDRLIEGGVDGIAILGSSGEFYGMSMETAKQYAEESLQYLKGRIPVYIGTGRLNVEETVELSNFALEQGSTAVMIVGPYYIGATSAGLEAYFNTVIDKVKGDVILYNYPDRTGHDLTAEIVLSLLNKHDNIVGYKDSVGAIAHTRDLIQKIKPHYPKFGIYSGFDENFSHVVLSGGDGCIAALSNLIPEICSEWVKAFDDEDLKKISEIQRKIDALMDFYSITTPFMPAMKYAISTKGVPLPLTCLLPAVEPNADQKQKIDSLLRRVL